MNILNEELLYMNYKNFPVKKFLVKPNMAEPRNSRFVDRRYPYKIEVHYYSDNTLKSTLGWNTADFETEKDARDMALILTLSS